MIFVEIAFAIPRVAHQTSRSGATTVVSNSAGCWPSATHRWTGRNRSRDSATCVAHQIRRSNEYSGRDLFRAKRQDRAL